MKEYDLVVIGSGAGLMVLEAALNQGLRCAVIENSKFGGTCLTKGCIPSKMLVYPADFIRESERGEKFGLKMGTIQPDWEVISRRMWEQIDLHYEIEKNLRSIPTLGVYHGTGRFTSPHTMEVETEHGTEKLRGEKFVIGAGSRSSIPPIDGLEESGYVTAETFFGEKFPKRLWKSLAIVGGGAIGAEFAHIFSAMGSEVTVIEQSDRILPSEEEEVSRFVEEEFVQSGITLFTGSKVVSVSPAEGGKRIVLQDAEGTQRTVECEELFLAAGVRSNADLLEATRAGVEVDQKGWIVTNEFLETSQPHIWALGDINGKYQFRHKANYEAQILSHNLFSAQEKEKVSYHAVPWTVFTHPQVAHVGRTERQLAEADIPYKIARNRYSEVVAGRSMGYYREDADNGFVKMLIGEDKKILGVHIAGPQAALLLQPFVYLMNAGHRCRKRTLDSRNVRQVDGIRILCPQTGTYVPIHDSMVIHPSLSELTAWALENIENASFH